MRLLSIPIACLVLAGCGQGIDGGGAGAGSDDGPGETVTAAPAVDRSAAAPATREETARSNDERGEPRPVLEQNFVYGSTEDENLVGFFAAPEDITEPLPGIILIHGPHGLDENTRILARRLAGEGYAVLAVDLYGGIVAETDDDARVLMGHLEGDRQATLDNIRQAYDYLDRFALAPRIATLGVYLGGEWSLEAGLELADQIDAVVIYYGAVTADESRLAGLRAPVLGVFAEHDEFVPVHDVQGFRNTLRDLGKEAEVLIYPDAARGFAEPGGPAFDAEAAADAWQKTLEFLSAELRQSD